MSSQDHFGDINVPGPQAPVAAPGRGSYQFSSEELRVLRECNKESFFQRCLPIGTLLGVATYYGVQTGHLKASPRWGATPKVVVASIIGYFIGKLSYQGKCAEKLMQLPDSRLGALLRERKRGGTLQESLEPGYGPGVSLNPFSSASPADSYSDITPAASTDIDTTRPDQSGLDDSMRPSVDNNPVFEEEMPPVQDKTTTYDELRRRNRDEYQRQRSTSFRSVQPPAEAARAAPKPSDEREVSTPRRTNKYGDVME